MAMELIRHIAGLYSGKAFQGDPTQVYITGNEIWMAQQILASQHTEQAEGAQGEPLSYWEPCNPACDPELNGFRDRKCSCAQARAALAQPSPAPELELERPEVVVRVIDAKLSVMEQKAKINDGDELMTVAQHDRIVGALQRQVSLLALGADQAMAQRDDALEKMAEREGQSGIEFVYDSDELVAVPRGLLGAACHAIDKKRDAPRTIAKLREYAHGLPAPVAQAGQVPEWSSAKPTVEGAYWVRGNGLDEPAVILVKLDQGELWCNLHMNNTETDFGYGYTIAQLSSEFEWFGPLAAAPVAQAGQVPQAWLDVQAERRRQVAAEGWTPEHDNEHDHGQMARAAACYALAGSSAADDKTTALLVSLAWPWDQQWWKPTTARRDLVKACALTLAEIERLDRAAAPTAGGSDA
ncbi:hypothetical protein [Pseudomonas sp. NBRC 100443]|uniref:hypothetical protein n=1 Tax=Pseudomonas sp. NBRC 100443 TaxID=1113665 RepID=UPI0025528FFB|nr:hypothetical protein [Pseudomonas sp. NBRC 100443]